MFGYFVFVQGHLTFQAGSNESGTWGKTCGLKRLNGRAYGRGAKIFLRERGDPERHPDTLLILFVQSIASEVA